MGVDRKAGNEHRSKCSNLLYTVKKEKENAVGAEYEARGKHKIKAVVGSSQ